VLPATGGLGLTHGLVLQVCKSQKNITTIITITISSSSSSSITHGGDTSDSREGIHRSSTFGRPTPNIAVASIPQDTPI